MNNLVRDDLQHMALLLYVRLPTIFGHSQLLRFYTRTSAQSDVEGNRNNALMSNEELCERARVYVREYAAWVNNKLLPNTVLDPGYPRSVI